MGQTQTFKHLEAVLTAAKVKPGEVVEVEDRQGSWRQAKFSEDHEDHDGVAMFSPPGNIVWIEAYGANYTGRWRPMP